MIKKMTKKDFKKRPVKKVAKKKRPIARVTRPEPEIFYTQEEMRFLSNNEKQTKALESIASSLHVIAQYVADAATSRLVAGLLSSANILENMTATPVTEMKLGAQDAESEYQLPSIYGEEAAEPVV